MWVSSREEESNLSKVQAQAWSQSSSREKGPCEVSHRTCEPSPEVLNEGQVEKLDVTGAELCSLPGITLPFLARLMFAELGRWFSASLEGSRGHVTKLWPMGCKWKWWETPESWSKRSSFLFLPLWAGMETPCWWLIEHWPWTKQDSTGQWSNRPKAFKALDDPSAQATPSWLPAFAWEENRSPSYVLVV